jgi:hypothetical protein
MLNVYFSDRPALSAGSSKYGSEKNWAFVITQHLLSKLSVTTEFLADSATMKEVNCCPCDRKEMIPCKTGNTSIGKNIKLRPEYMMYVYRISGSLFHTYKLLIIMHRLSSTQQLSVNILISIQI